MDSRLEPSREPPAGASSAMRIRDALVDEDSGDEELSLLRVDRLDVVRAAVVVRATRLRFRRSGETNSTNEHFEDCAQRSFVGFPPWDCRRRIQDFLCVDFRFFTVCLRV